MHEGEGYPELVVHEGQRLGDPSSLHQGLVDEAAVGEQDHPAVAADDDAHEQGREDEDDQERLPS